MAAKPVDLSIEQGSTFARKLTFSNAAEEPINLDGYSFRGSIRKTAKEDATLGSFVFTIESPASGGIVQMTMSAANTALLPTTGADYTKVSTYTYDVEMIDTNGIVTRIMNGAVTVSPEVTR